MSEEYSEWYWKLYRWFLWDVKHVHKTIWVGIKNIWKWFPVIWKDRDWDYYYIYQVLKFKLEKQANYLIKHGSHENANRDAELMMTCVRLIDNLQNESYPSYTQHNKAKRLLFKIMNDNIESWWD